MLKVVIFYLNSYIVTFHNKYFIIFYEVNPETGLFNKISDINLIINLNADEIYNSMKWNDKAFNNDCDNEIFILIKY
jgi:hypothetical protein